MNTIPYEICYLIQWKDLEKVIGEEWPIKQKEIEQGCLGESLWGLRGDEPLEFVSKNVVDEYGFSRDMKEWAEEYPDFMPEPRYVLSELLLRGRLEHEGWYYIQD